MRNLETPPVLEGGVALPENKRPRWIGWGSVLVLVSLVGLGTWGWKRLFDPSFYPVRHIVVSGKYRYLNTETIQQKVLTGLAGKSFFWVSVNDVSNLLKGIPWVKRVYVKRVWPDKLDIQIEEYQIVARFGTDALLTVEGHIFTPDKKELPPIEPIILTEHSQANTVIQQYYAWDAKLSPLGLKISDIALDLRRAWRVKLKNGLEIEFGRNDLDKKLSRFIDFYQQYLVRNNESVVHVDLRYTNGLSVGWKAG
jgi:cell division protein FtsQ